MLEQIGTSVNSLHPVAVDVGQDEFSDLVRASKHSAAHRLVRRVLSKQECPPDKQDKATRTELEQAEVLRRGDGVGHTRGEQDAASADGATDTATQPTTRCRTSPSLASATLTSAPLPASTSAASKIPHTAPRSATTPHVSTSLAARRRQPTDSIEESVDRGCAPLHATACKSNRSEPSARPGCPTTSTSVTEGGSNLTSVGDATVESVDRSVFM